MVSFVAGLLVFLVQLDAEGFEVGDVGVFVIGDGRDHHPVARQVLAGNLLDARQRLDFDRAELAEIDLRPRQQIETATKLTPPPAGAAGRMPAVMHALDEGGDVFLEDAFLRAAGLDLGSDRRPARGQRRAPTGWRAPCRRAAGPRHGAGRGGDALEPGQRGQRQPGPVGRSWQAPGRRRPEQRRRQHRLSTLMSTAPSTPCCPAGPALPSPRRRRWRARPWWPCRIRGWRWRRPP